MVDLSTSKDLEQDVKLPYVIENKILMSPGVWNRTYYPPEEVEKAFATTDWNDKHNRNLFWDHSDSNSRDWIGEVRNQRILGNSIVGDLYVVDKPAAMKLAYGAKFGISPKVFGDEDDKKILRDFTFKNFSVVIDPAVKTAFINNSQATTEDVKTEKQRSIWFELSNEIADEGDVPESIKILFNEVKNADDALYRWSPQQWDEVNSTYRRLQEADKFYPPKAAQEAAKKVLEWKEKYGDEVTAMTEVGWARANQLAKGEGVSKDVLTRMAQFNRHRENAKINPKFKDEPWKDNGYVAWLGWGADEGINWALRKVESLKRNNKLEDNPEKLEKEQMSKAQEILKKQTEGIEKKMEEEKKDENVQGTVAETIVATENVEETVKEPVKTETLPEEKSEEVKKPVEEIKPAQEEKPVEIKTETKSNEEDKFKAYEERVKSWEDQLNIMRSEIERLNGLKSELEVLKTSVNTVVEGMKPIKAEDHFEADESLATVKADEEVPIIQQKEDVTREAIEDLKEELVALKKKYEEKEQDKKETQDNPYEGSFVN